MTVQQIDKLNSEAEALSARAGNIKYYIGIWLFIAVVLFVLGIYFGYRGFENFNFRIRVSDYEKLGSYLAGTVGSLWSGAGLVLIYVAFLGQKQQLMLQSAELIQNRSQLELQRKELEDTREELKGQKEQLERQAKNSERQLFENTFFIMHSRLLELKHRLMFIQDSETYQQPLMNKPFIMNFVEIVLGNFHRNDPSGATKMFDANFIEISSDIDSLALGSYLEQLKYLIYHIRTVEKDIDTKFYYNYIKSDLSIHEKIFLNLYKNSLMTGEFKVNDNDFNTLFGVTKDNLISIFGSEGSKVVYEYLLKIPVDERST